MSSPTTCHMSQVMCHMSCVTCHVSHVTCHMSHVIYYMSHVFFSLFFLLFLDKMVGLVGGGSVINGAYPVQFSLQINTFKDYNCYILSALCLCTEPLGFLLFLGFPCFPQLSYLCQPKQFLLSYNHYKYPPAIFFFFDII